MRIDMPEDLEATSLLAELITTGNCVLRTEAVLPPLTLTDVAALLTDGRARFPHVAVTRDGTPLPPRAFCSDRTINGTAAAGLLDLTKVEALLIEGASVVLNELDTYWPSLAGICAQLRQQTGLDVGAMAFVSPPRCGAFPLHQDPVHVVVIQCVGVKDWVVFDHFEGQDAAGPVGRPEGVMPRHSLTFQPGDVFSMPAGRPHQATSSGGWSIHVSITLKRVDPLIQIKDEIRTAVQQAAGIRDPTELRAAVIGALTSSCERVRPAASCDRGVAQERLLAIMRQDDRQ